MATYKVIQDIEAEDKLIGPLSLRQFIYAILTVTILFVAWQLARVQILLGLPLIVPAIFFGLLAAPLGAYQSSEIWLLAKIRFYVKPRRRIWDQSGLKQLVTITVPKVIEQHLSDNLSQTEVKSRLKALANTIDSRGWAIKNVNTNMFAQSSYGSKQSSDRLLDLTNLPQNVDDNLGGVGDMLDEQNNPTAQHLQQMIDSNTKTRRQSLVSSMKAPARGSSEQAQPDYWFMNQPDNPRGSNRPGYKPSVVAPGSKSSASKSSSEIERKLSNQLHANQDKGSAAYGHMRTIDPAGAKPADNTSGAKADPAILGLANNDDLSVATIARQANKKPSSNGNGDDEVVVSLR